MAGRLDGKIAIVTGGARGIGAATVERFAAEGAAVLITDVLDAEGTALAERLARGGRRVAYEHLDVTSEADWGRVMGAAERRFDRPVNVLVNNAGILAMEPLADTTLETWQRIMNVNATGCFLGTRAGVRAMRGAGGGSIVNISSIAGIVASAQYGAYSASKGAVRLLTKSAAVAHAKEGIRVNSVHPGAVETPMTAGLLKEAGDAVAALHPIGRAAKPVEIANCCLFLASDESSFVTGAELVVDGGYTAQ